MDGSFGGRIYRLTKTGINRDRTKHDDMAVIAFDHARDNSLKTILDAKDVYIDQPLRALGRLVEKGAGPAKGTMRKDDKIRCNRAQSGHHGIPVTDVKIEACRSSLGGQGIALFL